MKHLGHSWKHYGKKKLKTFWKLYVLYGKVYHEVSVEMYYDCVEKNVESCMTKNIGFYTISKPILHF